MEIILRFSRREIDTVKQLVKDHKKDDFVVNRVSRNLHGDGLKITRSNCWHVLIMCLLTTRQRSGPQSHVYRFLASKPFPLRLAVVEKEKLSDKFTARVLKQYGGIQRYKTIGAEVSNNLKWFREKNWGALKARLEGLSSRRGYAPERELATWVADNFIGLGPKQSRNFLQALGLTRYEIPIDSRITKWLRNDFEFPLAVGAAALSDPDYYGFVNDAIRELCTRADTHPCVLDAVLFSRADGDAWNGVKPLF